MEPERRLSDDVLRQALDAAPDGIIVVDERGTIVFVNPMVERLFEYPDQELLGRSVDVLLPEHVRGAHAARRAGYVDQPRSRSMGTGSDLRGRRKSGAEFPLEISLSPLRTGDDLLVVVIVRDVAERRAADEELQHAHEVLGTGGRPRPHRPRPARHRDPTTLRGRSVLAGRAHARHRRRPRLRANRARRRRDRPDDPRHPLVDLCAALATVRRQSARGGPRRRAGGGSGVGIRTIGRLRRPGRHARNRGDRRTRRRHAARGAQQREPARAGVDGRRRPEGGQPPADPVHPGRRRRHRDRAAPETACAT